MLATPGGGSTYRGCFSTQAEALSAATNGGIKIPASASFKQMDDAIRQYNAGKLAVQSLTPAGIVRPQTNYVIGIFYDWTNFQSNSLNMVTTVSTGCLGASYGDNFPAGWNDVTESARGYINCNYTIPYENTGFGGSLNPCAQPCADFGALRNVGSSWRLKKTWP